MSIGICNLDTSKARVLGFALVSCTALSACVGGEGFSFAPNNNGASSTVVVPNTRQTTLARGTVKLKAPKGYCIDEGSVSTGLQGSSAMLATCSSLDGKGASADSSVMSVQVSARRADVESAPAIQHLIDAAQPRAVLQTKQKGNLALAQIATGGDDVFGPADPVHWRAVTELDTRLIVLGLFAPAGSDLAGDKGGQLLASLARGLSATRGTLLGLATESSENEEVAQPKSEQNASTPDTVDPEKKAGRGFIGRLLNRS